MPTLHSIHVEKLASSANEAAGVAGIHDVADPLDELLGGDLAVPV